MLVKGSLCLCPRTSLCPHPLELDRMNPVDYEVIADLYCSSSQALAGMCIGACIATFRNIEIALTAHVYLAHDRAHCRRHTVPSILT